MTQGEQEEEGRKIPSVTKKGSPFLEVKESKKKTRILFADSSPDNRRIKCRTRWWSSKGKVRTVFSSLFSPTSSSFTVDLLFKVIQHEVECPIDDGHDRVKSSFQTFLLQILSHVMRRIRKKVKHNFRLNASKLKLVFFGFFLLSNRWRDREKTYRHKKTDFGVFCIHFFIHALFVCYPCLWYCFACQSYKSLCQSRTGFKKKRGLNLHIERKSLSNLQSVRDGSLL